MKNITIAVCTLYAALCVGVLSADAGQQDRWYTESSWPTYDSAATNSVLGWVECMDAHPAGDRIYVLTDNAPVRLAAYTLDGQFMGITNTPHSNAQYLRVSPDGNVYAVANDLVSIYSPDLVHSNTLSFTNYTGTALTQIDGLDILPNGDLVMGRNGQVRIYDRDVRIKDSWTGSTNSVASMLSDIRSLAVGPDDLLYLVEGSSQDLKVYDLAGNFKFRFTTPYFQKIEAVGRDLTLYARSSSALHMYREDGAEITSSLGLRVPGFSSTTAQAKNVTILDDYRIAALGRFYSGHVNRVYILRRSSYVLQPKPVKHMPLPSVVNISQRQDAAVLDIDYRVFDADDDTVHVEALAFFGNSSDPEDAIRIETLIDGTAANRGSGITTSELHRLSWDIGADLPTNVVDVSVELMARDSNPMLAFDFVTLPSNGPDPELTISRVTVADSDLRALWYWLLSTGDVAITVSGEYIYGTAAAGPAYDGERLVRGTDTYTLGADFMFERLGVRRATEAEWTRAREASTPGTLNRFTPRFDMYGRPYQVNEYGIESSHYTDSSFNNGSWYVVPTTLVLP